MGEGLSLSNLYLERYCQGNYTTVQQLQGYLGQLYTKFSIEISCCSGTLAHSLGVFTLGWLTVILHRFVLLLRGWCSRCYFG